MKKILILTDWYEPGYKAGGPIRSCRNFVSNMHDQFDLYLITSNQDLGDKSPYKEVPSNSWTRRSGEVNVFYADHSSLNSNTIACLINEVNPDFIFMNSMYSYRFTILPLLLHWRNRFPGQIVLAPRGMLQQGAMQFKAAKKRLFLLLLNRLGIPKQIRFQATDPQEKQDILRYIPKAGSVQVVSNFTVPESFLNLPIEKKTGEIKLLYISRIIPKKNLLYILRLLTQVHFTFELSFSIYGEIEDASYWSQCQEAIGQLKSNVEVKYHGALPHEEVSKTLSQHHLFVLTTEGENFGHSIFESLSCGRPVLISDQTPWKNLEQRRVGWDIALNAPSLFVNALSEATAFDQKTFDEWSNNAASFAAEYSASAHVKEDYLTLFS